MNEDRLREFDAQVLRCTKSIIASPGRKRIMREELLAHLLAAYEDEQRRVGDESAAAESARRRFGESDPLRRQLQASVPLLERIVFTCLPRKESSMRHLIWLAGVLAFLVGTGLILPALAKYKQLGYFRADATWGLTIGLIITLAGVSAVIYGVRRLIMKPS